MGLTLTATSWMNDRLVTLKEKLAASETILQAYRESENLLDVEGVTSVSAGELSLISASLADARRKRSAAESEYRQIQSMKNAGWRSQLTVPAVLSNIQVQEFKTAEAKAYTAVEELSRTYGEKHPKMQSARSELDTARTNLEAQVAVVVSGIVPPNPLELLSTKRFAQLIGDLDETYDRIVIDSPPVQAVSDALVLSTFANAVIYVVKADDTAIPLAKKGVGRLLQNNAPMAGIVLNQVNISKAQKQGYSYGGYNDYYGYGGEKKA